MGLTKNDLGQIKGAVKEVVLEAMEPMMVATQKEFDGIKGQFNKMGERFDKLEKEVKDFRADNAKDHDRMDLRLGESAWRFEISNLKKRVVVLEDKAGVARKNF